LTYTTNSEILAYVSEKATAESNVDKCVATEILITIKQRIELYTEINQLNDDTEEPAAIRMNIAFMEHEGKF
jgi:hypothetical protein